MELRVLIYKMTHLGDPDYNSGIWGVAGCMGRVRGYSYDAVIGVGGTTAVDGIVGKLVWVGIGPRIIAAVNQIGFDFFHYYGRRGEPIDILAPELAKHLYQRKARVLISEGSTLNTERSEIIRICNRAQSTTGTEPYELGRSPAICGSVVLSPRRKCERKC